eukprot:TRINITY_DN81145_c0_g1_i1.p1 TRINITY_DN81145_c0_g1~~TRINITY_DN81145_c0_g1_i1.p1  ORF type:complete len:407 (-),score=56.02 TRINITY_DN81145_c0_g1_i1:199-1419(-)
MSRFSTISNQHSALRDLERQRLERLMGQLRKDVQSKNSEANSVSEGAPPSRRFQPSKRKPPAKMISRGATPTRASRPQADSDPSPPDSGGVPSAEMAWLLRVQGQLDEAAGEVETFLSQHGLERFATLLVHAPGAPGTSLEDLRAADEDVLTEAGIPESPRQRLLEALKALPDVLAVGLADEKSTPKQPLQSRASASGTPRISPEPTPRWASLGRAPPGWTKCIVSDSRPATGSRPPTRSGPVVTVDCCVGGSEPLTEQEKGVEMEVSMSSLQPHPPSSSRPSTASRPNTASRPTTSGRPTTAGSGTNPDVPEKACCYQCFKQVYLAHAVRIEPESNFEDCAALTTASRMLKSSQKAFCSDACADRYQQAVKERNRQGQELKKLRDSVLNSEMVSPGETSICHGGG